MVVATVKTFQPFARLASRTPSKMFENGGKGIGVEGQGQRRPDRARARRSARSWIETGYGLEGFITDGFAGETSRAMAPFFRDGRIRPRPVAGATRVAQRIAEGRNVDLESRAAAASADSAPAARQRRVPARLLGGHADHLPEHDGGGKRRRRRWISGVGPFGGGFGGGFGGWSSGGGFGGGVSADSAAVARAAVAVERVGKLVTMS